MITVTIYKDDGEVPSGVCVSGHAGYADKGRDVVCAAVSVLVINTVNSIETFTDDSLRLNTDEGAGLIDFRVVSPMSKETELFIRSLLLGLQEVKNAYGKDYIIIN